METFRAKITGVSTPPPDFQEGGKEHRKGILASSVLIMVLAFAEKVDPKLLGVEVSPAFLWLGLFFGHLYFFLMWRISSPIELDGDNKFWNLRGLLRQAILGGTKDLPGKRKAQHFLIRALPIWAFLAGSGILFWKAYVVIRYGTQVL